MSELLHRKRQRRALLLLLTYRRMCVCTMYLKEEVSYKHTFHPPVHPHLPRSLSNPMQALFQFGRRVRGKKQIVLLCRNLSMTPLLRPAETTDTKKNRQKLINIDVFCHIFSVFFLLSFSLTHKRTKGFALMTDAEKYRRRQFSHVDWNTLKS